MNSFTLDHYTDLPSIREFSKFEFVTVELLGMDDIRTKKCRNFRGALFSI